MINPAYGDLAQSFQLKRQDAALKTNIAKLAHELTSGRHEDIGAAVRGDFRLLAGIEGSITKLTAMKFAATEAAHQASATQAALTEVQDLVSDNAATLLSTSSGATSATVAAVTIGSAERFLSAVSALNTNLGGRYVLSGTHSDTKPLASGEEILTALRTLVAGATTATDVLAAVDGWFDAPVGGGGFLDHAYSGSDTAASYLPTIQSGANAGITAADPAIRSALRGLAVAALVSQGALGGDVTGRAYLVQKAGEGLMAASDGLTELRGQTGAAEAAIEAEAVRNATEISSLEIARAGIVAADPYETATALEETQTQLEMLYTITARLSRLSFADYLG